MGYSPWVCKESDMTELEHGMAFILGAFLMTEMVKNPPPTWETWLQSQGWEDPLEKGNATHSSILAWRIHSPWGCKESDMTERLSLAKIFLIPWWLRQ